MDGVSLGERRPLTNEPAVVYSVAYPVNLRLDLCLTTVRCSILAIY